MFIIFLNNNKIRLNKYIKLFVVVFFLKLEGLFILVCMRINIYIYKLVVKIKRIIFKTKICFSDLLIF